MERWRQVTCRTTGSAGTKALEVVSTVHKSLEVALSQPAQLVVSEGAVLEEERLCIYNLVVMLTSTRA